MNKKKVIVGIILIILIIVAIAFGIFKAKHDKNYLYNKDGTIVDGKGDLINKIKSVEDVNERKKQIDFSVQQNIITQQEADELY